MEQAILKGEFLLEKYPGKGGWTYARLPQIEKTKENPFGWKKVHANIDGYELRHYTLMPMGNGILFLPVKAEIRKKIKKEAGDFVWIEIYPCTEALPVPEEYILCLKDDPDAWFHFQKQTDSQKKAYIDWIFEAKSEETRIKRMAESINRLAKGLRMYDLPSQ